MDLTPDQFEDLIGAYALDACEPDEVAALDAYVRDHPASRAEVERLRDAAAALGAAGALEPPVALRDRVLDLAAERVRPVTPTEALQAETDRFQSFLATLSDDDLAAVTHNGLSVHDLVAHLEAIDRAFVSEADTPTRAYIGPNDVAEITAEDLPQHRGESFAETVTRFRRTREQLIGLGDRLPAERTLAGYSRDSTLVIRAFETWTHHDDIRRAVGRDEALPAPAVMRAMAELSVGSLPLALAVRGTARPGRTARVVLTGPCGGEWTIACAPGAEPGTVADVVISTSVVDWCRRFADRLDPDVLSMAVDGDEGLARELVGAADAFAGL
jgi:uncharacterized protein (TIGR03083 family)